MYIELYWKDYRRFGADGAIGSLALWLMSRLSRDYGHAIDTICVTGYCRSLAGPNKNLTSAFEAFEDALTKMKVAPSIRFSEKKKELSIEYATVWPTADEFQPDDDVLRVGTFRRAYLKLITLLEESHKKLGNKIDFDFPRLIADIKNLEPEVPQSLDQLAVLYLTYKSKKGDQAAS